MLDRINEVEKVYQKIKEIKEEYPKESNLENTSLLIFHGQMTKKDYEANEKMLKECQKESKSFLIIAGIDKFGTGVDVPHIDTVFFAAQLQFKGAVVQAVGRGLRLHPEKTGVILYDWCDARVLYKQANQRQKAYLMEYGSPSIVRMDPERL